jgi:hypothetical protein
MDAVVGEYSWNDAVQIYVPDAAEMQQPGTLRATKLVGGWQKAIQSLMLDEVEPWNWYTCADCGYGDSNRDGCRVHRIVHILANEKKKRLNPRKKSLHGGIFRNLLEI